MRERRHTPGPELHWAETWEFDFVSPSAGFGGWVGLTLWPNQGRAWYHAFLAGPDRPLLAVIDHDVPLPPTTLEIRTTGLWADHICETAHEHWTIGLEAFALGLDDPWEVYGTQRGDRVPLGLDLEWERVSPPVADLGATDDGYRQSCTVTGEVLIGADTIDLTAIGTRRHRWGRPDWWDRSRVCIDATVGDSALVVDRPGAVPSGGALVLGRERDVPSAHGVGIVEVAHGPAVPDAVQRIEVAGRRWHARPLAWAPLEVPDVEGRRSRLPRALCAAASTDGPPGWIWIRYQTPMDT